MSAESSKFDVFLCHNSKDKSSVRLVCEQLKRRGLRPWLDEEQLRPGERWQRCLNEHIEAIRSAAVFVGESGLGPWQELEQEAFLHEFVKRRCPVIPVVLSECSSTPELPLFLRGFTWVDFRSPHADPIDQLVWGITGRQAAVGYARTIPIQPPRFAFHCGPWVPPEFFVGRRHQLELAKRKIAARQNFLVVGAPRAGKTSFCLKMLDALKTSPEQDVIASYVNLEQGSELTEEVFLQHTLINLIGETWRGVFGGHFADLYHPDPAQRHPHLLADDGYKEFMAIYGAVTMVTQRHPGDAAPQVFHGLPCLVIDPNR